MWAWETFGSAELVSLTGTSMTFVALPWFVLATTGSAARMGWVLAAELAPYGLPRDPGRLARRPPGREALDAPR
jgi:hypothetical protein